MLMDQHACVFNAGVVEEKCNIAQRCLLKKKQTEQVKEPKV